MTEPAFVRETRMPIDDVERRAAWFGAQRVEATAAGVTFSRTCQAGERMLYEGWYEQPPIEGPDRGLGKPRWKAVP